MVCRIEVNFLLNPGDIVYKGQIIGEHTKENDIEVNVQRGKKLSNMRASGSDKAVKITPAINIFFGRSIRIY